MEEKIQKKKKKVHFEGSFARDLYLTCTTIESIEKK